ALDGERHRAILAHPVGAGALPSGRTPALPRVRTRRGLGNVGEAESGSFAAARLRRGRPAAAGLRDRRARDSARGRAGGAHASHPGTTQVRPLRSPGLAHWEWVGGALPRLASWATFGYLWGPSVLARRTGYVLYYATRETATARQCISAAVSLLPQGPFLDSSNHPFICQRERGGSIDPSPFVDDDGTPWLVWKSEGTLSGEPTRIWAQ